MPDSKEAEDGFKKSKSLLSKEELEKYNLKKESQKTFREKKIIPVLEEVKVPEKKKIDPLPEVQNVKTKSQAIPIQEVKIETKKNIPKEAPQNFYEFEQVFRELQGDDFHEYFKLISPNILKGLFKSNLTEEILLEIQKSILIYLEREEYNFSFEILKNLILIDRFDTVLMFLDENKNEFSKIFEKLKGKVNADELLKISKKFQ